MGGRCQLPMCFNEVVSVFPYQLRIGPGVCPHALEARCKYSCGTRVCWPRSTRSGGSAQCLHCPHALEARRSSGGLAHCLQQFWRLGALFTFASILSQTHFDECSLQFRLFPVPFDETITAVYIYEYPTNPWGTMMRPSIIVFVRYRDFIGG